MKVCINILIIATLISGCALIPNGLKSKSELLKDPEYVNFLEGEQRKKDIETLKFIGLANVKVIFLGDFGNQDGSDFIREKVRKSLIESPRFKVVENRMNADAVLTGVAGVDKSHNQSVRTDSYGNMQVNNYDSYAGVGMLRLVDIKTDSVIWSFEYHRKSILNVGASNMVADQIIDQLLNDTKSAEDLTIRTNILK